MAIRRRGPMVLVAMVIAACGAFSEDGPGPPTEVDGGGDAGGGDAGAGDATPADGRADRCNRSAPFGEAQPLDVLKTPFDQRAAWLNQDELVAFVSRETPNASLDLYSATRSTRTEAFREPVPVLNVNSDSEDNSPSLPNDALRLFFHSGRPVDGGPSASRVFVASRTSTNGPWSDPVPVGGLPEASGLFDPFVSNDGQTLYFSLFDAPSNDIDLWTATRDTATTFKSPTALATLNAAAGVYDVQPILTPDETVLYFASTRGMLGDANVWRAERTSRAVTFGTPRLVPEASTSLNDRPAWVSSDDCELWITRGLNGMPRSLLRLLRPK